MNNKDEGKYVKDYSRGWDRGQQSESAPGMAKVLIIVLILFLF